MAATATSYNPNKFNIGPGTLWVVDVPADGAFITLTNGTPDSTAHPTARHLGHTTEGSTFTANAGQPTKIFVDEVDYAVRTVSGGEGTAQITATLTQGADFDLLALLTPGQGTKFTATGKEGVKGGSAANTYVSVALIFPTIADPTKFEVIQLYKCQNTAGITKNIQKKDISKMPVTFEGIAITSRTASDSTWINWVQV